jgi:hypothetical protein
MIILAFSGVRFSCFGGSPHPSDGFLIRFADNQSVFRIEQNFLNFLSGFSGFCGEEKNRILFLSGFIGSRNPEEVGRRLNGRPML